MLKISDLNDTMRLTCPKCGQQDYFKEHQLVAETQEMNWHEEDGCYYYEGSKFDDVSEAEEIVCGVCGETVAINDDTLADQRNALIAAIEAALAEEHSTTEQERILRDAIKRYQKDDADPEEGSR